MTQRCMSPGLYGIVLSVFGLAVALNFVWEMAQAALYQPMGSIAEARWRCFVASVADGVMVLAIFGAGVLLFGRIVWFGRWSSGSLAFTVLLGALIAAVVEWWGLSTGRWGYDGTMPRVPGLELGVVPIVQIPLLALLTFWIAARLLNRPAGVNA
jgi:hypothetical protein